MIHLIDRVYLDYAEANPRPNEDRDPNRYIYVIDRGLSGISNVNTKKFNLFSVKNFDELVQKFESTTLLMDFLLANTNQATHKKIQIFCDEEAMVQILCAFWKGLFPKLTAEGGYRLYTNYRDFEFFKGKENVNYIAIDEDSRDISLDYFFEKYWGKSFEDFEELYNKTEAFVLTEKELNLIGLEFKIIRALLNPSEKNTKVLTEKFSYLFKKNLVKEIIENIDFVREYLFEFLVLDPDCKDAILLNHQSAISFLKENKKFEFLFDPNIPFSNYNLNFSKLYNYLYSNYNIIRLCKELIDAEVKILQKLELDVESAIQDKPCSNYIVQHKKEPENFSDLSDLSYTGKFRIFKELARKGRYNHYLVSSFFLSLKEDTKGILACFEE